MLYAIEPRDVLLLMQLLGLTFWDPFPQHAVHGTYAAIRQRISFAPKQTWIFAVVWSFLYVLMWLSVSMAYLERAMLSDGIAYALFALYGVMLLTTKTWTPLFFGLHRELEKMGAAAKVPPYFAYVAAFVDLVLLVLAVVAYIVLSLLENTSESGFYVPGLLLVPLLLWLLYAGALNIAAIKTDPSFTAAEKSF